MAGSSQTQIVRELSEAVNTLIGRAIFADKEIARIEATQTKLVDSLHAVDKRLVLVEHQLTELRSGGREWSNRMWTFAFSLLSAVLAAAATYYLGFKK